MPPTAARRTVYVVLGDHSLRQGLATAEPLVAEWLQRVMQGGEMIQDVSNHPAVSLEPPGCHLAFDQDPAEAESTRRRTLAWLARDRLPVQGFHFHFPGRAFVEAAEDAYRAVAIRRIG